MIDYDDLIRINVTLNDTGIADIVDVSFPSWAMLNSYSTLSTDRVNIRAVDLMRDINANDTNVTLATVFVRTGRPGVVEVNVDSIELDGDDGSPIDVAMVPVSMVPRTDVSSK